MTSTRSSSQKFDKLEWIQQKIKKRLKKSESSAAPPTRAKLKMSSMLRYADGWLVR